MNEVNQAIRDALFVYGLTAGVSFAVAGIIWLLHVAIGKFSKPKQ